MPNSPQRVEIFSRFSHPARDTSPVNFMAFSFPVRKESDEVFYAATNPVNINHHDLEELKRLAAVNPRQRARICAHTSPSDLLHEMFIVHGQGAYVRPHRHLTRREGMQVLEGIADIVIFSDNGEVREVRRLDSVNFYQRLNAPLYHMLLIRSKWLVFHEATTGPFERSDTEFAPWSPEDCVTDTVVLFLDKIESAIANWRKANG
jgi:cupin fold WbuC family metalloprotein